MKKALFAKEVDSERRVTGVVLWTEISMSMFRCVDVRSVRVGDYRRMAVAGLKLRISAVEKRKCVCCVWSSIIGCCA
jgi:hypothetical protein